jgi:NAD(P)-dependent dehydrogenase (short-subunit alcohol dehydrogenase family)
VLDIDSVYDPSKFKGKRVVITGGAQGLGLALVQELHAHGADVGVICLASSEELDAISGVDCAEGCDVSNDEQVAAMVRSTLV